MAARVLQMAEVSNISANIKFNYTLDIDYIVDVAFTLTKQTGTPTTIAGAFKTIDISRDYNSIGRILKLYFAVDLLPSTSYRLTVTGLRSVSGTVLPDDYFEFTTSDFVGGPDPNDIVPEDQVFVVEDFSIKEVTPTVVTTVIEAVPVTGFGITAIDPEEDIAYYLAADTNNGVITLTFNKDVAAMFVSSSYLKMQRKAITLSGATRWESVTIDMSYGATNKEVEVHLPSLDAVPVYATAGHDYWETGYKYRLRVSGSVGDNSATPSTLLSEKEFIFLPELTPLYLDVEKVRTYYPDAVLTEAAEIIYKYSLEIQDMFGVNVTVTQAMSDYILAATLCDLSKIYAFGGGLAGFGESDGFTLGDLTITKSSGGGNSKNSLYRGNASSWCELASLYREELLYKNVNMKGVVRGEAWENPIPSRKLRRFD